MTSAEEPTEVTRYLRELDAALADIPSWTATEIRAGVEEELSSLDRVAARERIAQLGDPALIAAEARREDPDASTRRSSGLASRIYIVLASLAVAVGIYVIPLVGALAGFVLVWVSPAWQRWEKATATVIPLTAGLLTATFFVLTRIPSSDGVGSIVPGFDAPPVDEFGGPWYALIFSPLITVNALVVVSVANLAVGIWLLVQGLRRA